MNETAIIYTYSSK